jgi:hypothetical protein
MTCVAMPDMVGNPAGRFCYLVVLVATQYRKYAEYLAGWPAQETRRVVLQFRRALGDPYPDRAAQAFMRTAILPVNDRGDAARA